MWLFTVFDLEKAGVPKTKSSVSCHKILYDLPRTAILNRSGEEIQYGVASNHRPFDQPKFRSVAVGNQSHVPFYRGSQFAHIIKYDISDDHLSIGIYDRIGRGL